MVVCEARRGTDAISILCDGLMVVWRTRHSMTKGKVRMNIIVKRASSKIKMSTLLLTLGGLFLKSVGGGCNLYQKMMGQGYRIQYSGETNRCRT